MTRLMTMEVERYMKRPEVVKRRLKFWEKMVHGQDEQRVKATPKPVNEHRTYN